jgi:PTS system fructose-specific IIA component/PTS system nitrogen regulatory IIA component
MVSVEEVQSRHTPSPGGKGVDCMKLTDFVVADAIVADLQASSKEEAIRAMVTALKDSGRISADDEDAVVTAILKREELGSTGIGNGVAVPHTKHPSVDHLIAGIALSKEGVDFASLDGEVVHIFFLLVSPPDRPGDHLRGLENISRHLRNQNFCNFLRQAKSKQDVIELLQEADDNQLE